MQSVYQVLCVISETGLEHFALKLVYILVFSLHILSYESVYSIWVMQSFAIISVVAINKLEHTLYGWGKYP